MVKAEFARLLRTKSLFILTVLSLFLVMSWIYSNYVSGSKALAKGIPYAETSLVLLEPQSIFFQSMLQVTLSVYIFPYVIVGVMLVYDDLKEKTLLHMAVLTKERKKYLITKISVLLIYNLVMIGICFGLSVSFAFLMPGIGSSNWRALISVHTILSFLMFWFGLTFWGLAAMTVTFLTNSGIVGSGVALYLLIERIYTSTTAVVFRNPILMRVNEFLPWTNFNTLFTYASNLEYLLSDLSQEEILANASILTMYRMMEYNGIMVPYPYLKDIAEIVTICLLYSICVLGILFYSYLWRISKM